MELIVVGKLVNTHGLKGEVKIKSDFERKDLIFKKGKKLIIDNTEFVIKNYKVYKDTDLLQFEGYIHINDVEQYKGYLVYIDRDRLELPEGDYIYADLIGMKIVNSKGTYGSVVDYTNNINPLLEINNDNKTYYIPLKSDFIERVSVKENKIYVNDRIEELII